MVNYESKESISAELEQSIQLFLLLTSSAVIPDQMQLPKLKQNAC
jgi:hypothetical protein